MQVPEDILAVIEKYLAGKASAEEKDRLQAWYHSFDQEEIEVPTADPHAAENMEARLRQRLSASLGEMGSGLEKHGQKDPAYPDLGSLRSFSLIRAAAVVLILLSAGLYFYLKNFNRTQPQPARAAGLATKNEIRPGGNKATLLLANGSEVILDSAQAGILVQEGSEKVVKTDDGQIAYTVSKNAGSVQPLAEYNTMTTPRGGQYKLVLSDGSRIWLNAASSVRYPVTFGDSVRTVEITGEAYFEIAPLLSKKDKKRIPFVVKIHGASGEGSEVQVLGTHFNISAYDDDAFARVTLLEGSVRMKKGNSTAMLLPGQYAAVNPKTKEIELADDPEAETAIAWKEGRFEFNSRSNIREIMRRLARWYDVDVVYEQDVADKVFGGAIPQQANVTDVLKMLELTGSIHFKIENRKVTVMK